MNNKWKERIKKLISKSNKNQAKEKSKEYCNRFIKNAFGGTGSKQYEHYEASITKRFHSIEKGLSYTSFRAGFGLENVLALIDDMKKYSEVFSVEAFFYETALSCLYRYIEKNREYGYVNLDIEQKIKDLPGKPNDKGGALSFVPLTKEELLATNFSSLMTSRHSIRHFSGETVDMKDLKEAIEIAQYTPSACNRQGWSVKVIESKKVISDILENQNGNSGFGQEFDKLVIVIGDLRYSNIERELHQVYIDGGMYAMNVLNALYYKHIASVPLSAALTKKQEHKIRDLLHLDEAEVLVMFIGVGCYPKDDICYTTCSARRPAKYEIIS